MRRPFVAGNWKMNLSRSSGTQLVQDIRTGLEKLNNIDRIDIAVCPPSIYLYPIAEAAANSPIATGAQNCYYETNGAFTGELSPQMIKDTGAKYVIIGHSERRHTIGHLEDDRMLNLKVRAAQHAGLTPILCVGETLDERKSEKTLDVLTFQLTAGINSFQPSSPQDLVIAYEPVWAIGTGEVATPDQAQQAHAHLRNQLRQLAGNIADQIRILYGGSVKPDNATHIFEKPDVDGGLIGGASLKPDAFLGIIAAALETTAN